MTKEPLFLKDLKKWQVAEMADKQAHPCFAGIFFWRLNKSLLIFEFF
ncbi:MAG: hypothetical protein IJV27_09125 [Prevotella sp.]|nr:hypothetical protein [Prevotella sp.]